MGNSYCVMCNSYHELGFHTLPANHPVRAVELSLEPSPPRAYPTNYLGHYSTVVRLRAHTHYWDGTPVI